MNVLKELRYSNNLTQDDIAYFLDYSRSNYSNMERNNSYDIDTYVKLSYFYNINLYFLLNITKEKIKLNNKIKKDIKAKYNINKDGLEEVIYDIPRK